MKDLLKNKKNNLKIIILTEVILLMTTVVFVFAQEPPETPQSLNIVNNSGSTIELSWNESEKGKYRIFRKEDDKNYTLIGMTTDTHFTDELPDDKDYQYAVVSVKGIKASKKTIIKTDDLNFETSVESEEVFDSIDDAAEYLRKEMKQRQTKITLKTNASNNAKEIFNQAIEHTGNPKEGDYLKYQYEKYKAHTTINNNIATITYNISYYTTLAQEKEVDKSVKRILKELNLAGKTDYEKIQAIYQYICKTTEYDNAQHNNNNTKRTAYSVFIKKESVCQGYSLAMYRLLLEEGIDTRIISGIGVPELGPAALHAWNIVKYNGEYYYLDASWNDVMNLQFRLYPQGEFEKTHIRDDEYAKESFCKKYRISANEKNRMLSKNIVLKILDMISKEQNQ